MPILSSTRANVCAKKIVRKRRNSFGTNISPVGMGFSLWLKCSIPGTNPVGLFVYITGTDRARNIKRFRSHIKHVYMNLMFEYIVDLLSYSFCSFVCVSVRSACVLGVCLSVRRTFFSSCCCYFWIYIYLNIQHILNIKHRIKSSRYLLIRFRPCASHSHSFMLFAERTAMSFILEANERTIFAKHVCVCAYRRQSK